MKSINVWSVLACAGLVAGLAGPVLGQEPGRGGGGLMGALDRNGNGKLEPEEIDLAVASLRKLDKNGDGEITAEEVFGTEGRPDRAPGAPGQRGGPGGRPQGLPDFARIDKDGDGKISKEEAPERMRERFDELDANGDGFFDKAEQEELIKRLRERFQQGGPRRPGQPEERPERPGSGGEGGADQPRRPAPKE